MTQQQMFPGMSMESKPFTPIDRSNYDITAELLAHFGEGNKSQVSQGLYGLRSAYCGFVSTEIDRHKLRLPDLGVPHQVLLGMTPAEILALYMGIDAQKMNMQTLASFNGKGVEQCISQLIQNGFGISPGPLRRVAADAKVDGYNTGKGGLVHRMRQIIHANPQLELQFREIALSTIRASADYIEQIQDTELDELVSGLVNAFEWKYQKEVRAAQAVAARK